MSSPSSQQIALWVERELTERTWVPIDDVCRRALARQLPSYSEADVDELMEGKLEYIADHIRNALSDRSIDGKYIDIEIDDEKPPYLRRMQDHQPSLLDRLRRITPAAFEAVCANILQALGASEASTTQQSHDGGIDFIAKKLSILQATFPVPQSCTAVVIGQAKRFTQGAVISETLLRKFVGASVLKRHQMAMDGTIGPLMPTLYAFWTTSDFDKNAKRYARNVGLWYMDGCTVANYVDKLSLTQFLP